MGVKMLARRRLNCTNAIFSNRKHVFAAVLLLALLAIAACAFPRAQAEKPPPLLIGQLNALSGSLAYSSPSLRNAATLAADHINRAGGIDGAPVVIISRDTGSQPEQGVEAARALIDGENVVAILGARASSVTLAVAEHAAVPAKRLQISGISTSPDITGLPDDDFLFRTIASDDAQGVVLARLALEQGYQTVGVIYLDNSYGRGLADTFEKTFTSLGGVLTTSTPHADDQPTYTSELQRVTAGNPDALVTISYPGQAEVYIREALDGGYSGAFLLVTALKSAEMIEAIGWDALEGVMGTDAGSPPTPRSAAFTAAYTDTYGEAHPMHASIAQTYDATVLIALAAVHAGSATDSEAIRDALRSVANPPGEPVGPGYDEIKRALSLIAQGKQINYEGASGDVDFDDNGDVVSPIEIWQIEEGKIMSTGRFELP